jgi:hypothetical protein
MRAIAYMDSSLGIILDAVEKWAKSKQHLVRINGRPFLPDGGNRSSLPKKLGKINDGRSWVSLIFNGPNIDPQIVSHQVSQSSIAPSILGYLNLDVSNSFMGIDLLSNRDSIASRAFPPVFSFEYGDMGMWEDSMTYYLSPIQGENQAVALKSYLEPTWDTTQLVNGFTQAAPIDIPAEKIEAKTKTMRAVSEAWKYIIYKNKLMPPKGKGN